MSNRPTPQAGILDIAAYVPGRSGAPGSASIKLSANESPLGASPRAIAAFGQVAQTLDIYPEGSSRLLREALGAVHGLDPERIVCGNGSDDLLHLLAQAYLGEGDAAVMSQYGFAVYPIITRAAGSEVIVAAEPDFVADVDGLLAAVTEDTRIVFLANPNNPTGTYLPASEVKRLHAGLRPDVLLVIDCAYAEYVTVADYTVGTELVEAADNVVMVRTFSKIGLGGARLGWMYGPLHIVDAVNRVRGPFNVNATAIEAGIAAIRDREHIARSVAHNEQWLAWLTEEFGKLGLRVTPSVGNFLLIHFPEDAKHSAARADDYLTARGYILRRVAGYGFPNALRMTVGTEEANRGVIAALTEFLKS